MDRSEFADDVFPDDLWEPDPDDDIEPCGICGEPDGRARDYWGGAG